MDGRRISVVELRHPLEIMVASPYHPIISTSRLELMERRPGQEAGPENAVVPDHVDILIASPLPDEIILTILKAIRIGHIIILGFC